ncbi:PRD domain-containing protein [Brevibacillus dissolubilis]|uniref:PRD domain-containing protein n=1 Tax=Brevibacillus dissolubilis TaxID=1844116 RepID=UPI0011174497|nr:PRD domain-containing protein [Brevibacillus dissolubilis]
MEGTGYKVSKVLNNNVVFAVGPDKQEVVLVGKGLGFGKKAGERIEHGQFDKEFRLTDSNQSTRYSELLSQTDERIVSVCEEIIAYAQEKLGEMLHAHIHISLTDHIAFALERIRKGQTITNTTLTEIRSLYPKEYAIAEHAVELVKRQLGTELPRAEEGFIAMHIHSARANATVGKLLRGVELVSDLVKLIEKGLGIMLDPSSMDYARLVTDLRFTIERVENGEFTENHLVSLLKRDFAKWYSLAEQVGHRITQVLELPVHESEIGYLTIHLSRLQNRIA